MKALFPVLLIFTSSLAVVRGQPKPDTLQDGLIGSVQSVLETYSQSECKTKSPEGYAGSMRLTSYDREGNKATEAFELYSCDAPRIQYDRAIDGTVLTYSEIGRCQNSLPYRIPVYRLVREYDSAGNISKEVSYLKELMVWRSDYTYDRKSRLVKKTTLSTAEPYTFDKRITVIKPSTFKPFTIEEIYKYGTAAFPKKVMFVRDGKATGSYSYQYKYDARGNWVKRIEIGGPPASPAVGSKTVTCHQLTYY
jgi:hypothetical protein